MDVVDQKTRSRMMAGIRGKDTKPELIVRRALHSAGFRYRLHRADLPGSPDIVMPGRKLAIFVHGCFWHRHGGCKAATTPSTRPDFWARKFEANVERDRRSVKLLEDAGWNVHVVWECETKGKGSFFQPLLALLADIEAADESAAGRRAELAPKKFVAPRP